jgi:hypothetical protein
VSATEKLLLNMKEYYELLGFLNTKYPEILAKWAQAQETHRQRDDDATNPDGQIRNGYNT